MTQKAGEPLRRPPPQKLRDLIAALSKLEREEFEERAGIIADGCKLSREDSEWEAYKNVLAMRQWKRYENA